jgi:hypothetical protein
VTLEHAALTALVEASGELAGSADVLVHGSPRDGRLMGLDGGEDRVVLIGVL